MRNTLLLVLCATLAQAANAADKAGITKDQADQIIQSLKALTEKIDKIPAGRPAAPPLSQKAKITIDPRYTIGSKTAPLTLVEFTDYQCPFCSQWHKTTFADIKTNYIETGKLRFAVRDNPLSIHLNAMISAEAAHCAGAQGQYWTFSDMMALNPDRLNLEQFLTWMGQLYADASAFKECMANHTFKADIDADIAQAYKIGLNGTPAFVIGRSTPDGVDGETVMGALPYQAFEARLQDLSKVQ